MLELIVNKENDTESIILVQNGIMIEYYTSTEEERKRRLEGNIYIGEVGEIVKGMQSAFIEFGEPKKGFIHLKDVLPKVDETKQTVDTSIDITKILKPKQKILIQIKKDSDSIKGAKVSTHINLPGKYIVLMPNTDFITISQKIDSEKNKEELINLIKKNLPRGFGAIARTSAEEASEELIKKDIDQLVEKWNKIQENFKKSQNEIKLIWQSEDIIEKIIQDLITQKIDLITTNNNEEYLKLKEKYEPLGIKVTLNSSNNLFEKYELNKQIEKLKERKVWLNCGGFITIDKTEALTAIDVNTGKYTGKRDAETTIFKVNKEASLEIAKQLRLRDIGGIIIIDYIDMKNKENKQKIQEILADNLKFDRAKTQIEGFTKLNLMELTRKHICSHINENM